MREKILNTLSSSLLVLLIISFIYLPCLSVHPSIHLPARISIYCACTCLYVYVHVCVKVPNAQAQVNGKLLRVGSLHVWVPGIKLRSFGSLASSYPFNHPAKPSPFRKKTCTIKVSTFQGDTLIVHIILGSSQGSNKNQITERLKIFITILEHIIYISQEPKLT